MPYCRAIPRIKSVDFSVILRKYNCTIVHVDFIQYVLFDVSLCYNKTEYPTLLLTPKPVTLINGHLIFVRRKETRFSFPQVCDKIQLVGSNLLANTRIRMSSGKILAIESPSALLQKEKKREFLVTCDQPVYKLYY